MFPTDLKKIPASLSLVVAFMAKEQLQGCLIGLMIERRDSDERKGCKTRDARGRRVDFLFVLHGTVKINTFKGHQSQQSERQVY
jgi:hypothetical protein